MRLFLACLLGPLLAVFVFNQVVDAGNFGSASLVRALAATQRDDQLIAAPDQLDHRAWVRTRLLAPHAVCPDVLITGSSTVSKLSSDMFPGRRIFNAFVAGPSMEDLEALTTILESARCRPEWIVVGVDPWWVANAALEDRRWIGWVDDYLAFDGDHPLLNAAVRADLAWSRFQDHFGFQTTRESLAVVRRTRRNANTRLIEASGPALEDFCTSDSLAGYYVRAVDGHAVPCTNLDASPHERDRAAEDYVHINPHAMGEWREVDAERIANLKLVVRRWTEAGSHVILVGPPFNPVTYEALQQHPRIGPNLASLDATLVGLAPGVIFLNLRNASSVPCSREEFLDSHHAGSVCEGRVAGKIAAVMK